MPNRAGHFAQGARLAARLPGPEASSLWPAHRAATFGAGSAPGSSSGTTAGGTPGSTPLTPDHLSKLASSLTSTHNQVEAMNRTINNVSTLLS